MLCPPYPKPSFATRRHRPFRVDWRRQFLLRWPAVHTKCFLLGFGDRRETPLRKIRGHLAAGAACAAGHILIARAQALSDTAPSGS